MDYTLLINCTGLLLNAASVPNAIFMGLYESSNRTLAVFLNHNAFDWENLR